TVDQRVVNDGEPVERSRVGAVVVVEGAQTVAILPQPGQRAVAAEDVAVDDEVFEVDERLHPGTGQRPQRVVADVERFQVVDADQVAIADPADDVADEEQRSETR
ncbi:hypothetical protein LSH36_57g01006, partial [Paralvinella palmiformis]